MARITVRYLVCRLGAAGELPRWFWQPSSAMRAEGWRPERVPADWDRFDDASEAGARLLEAAAVARAQTLNDHLDATRAAAALKATRPPAPPALRTLGELILAYQADQAFLKLAPKTRSGYAQCLAKLQAWGGDAPVRAIDATRVERLQAGFAATPSYGNAVVRVLRLLLEWGRRRGWVAHNAAVRPGLLPVEVGGVIWPRQAVDLFVETADAMGHHSMGTAVLLNSWLGQRQGDVLRMPRAALRRDGGTLIIRQSKRGAGVSLPLGMVAELSTRLAAELARGDAAWAKAVAAAAEAGRPEPMRPASIIVSEATGAAYRADHFRHLFARIRAEMARAQPAFETDWLMPGREADEPDAFRIAAGKLTFMRLRHTAVTRLAEAGCETPLIAAVTGHSQTTVQALMERYMVRTAQLARVAFQRRMDAEAPAAATVRGAAG